VKLGGYPGELRKLLGIWVEEIDSLLPEMKNRMVLQGGFGQVQGEYECGLLCDLLHLEGAQALAVYGEDFYAGMPALTVNEFGAGKAYYVAADAEDRMIADLCRTLCEQSGIAAPFGADAGIELVQRKKDGAVFTFVLNHNSAAASIHLGGLAAEDLLTGSRVTGTVEVNGYGVMILRHE
jgi:beta-galactosidase